MTILTNSIDIYSGTDSSEYIYGLDGGDIINARGGNDIVYGGDGNDLITGGTGADTIYGGGGSDTASYAFEDANLAVDLETGNAWVSGEKDTLRGIENITGTAFGDSIMGNLLANTLAGNYGPDSLWGRGGHDTLYGGGDNDSLYGGEGADRLDGGSGQDKVGYVNSSASVIVNLVTGMGLGGEAQNDIYISIEDVDGSAHDDVITGNAWNNTLVGNGGNDQLYGGRGNDTLMGSDGDDIINGGSGDDYIAATAGHDLISGGYGYDSDMLSYLGSDAAVMINLQTGAASGGFADDHTITGIENLMGSNFGDTLMGNGLNNTLWGAAGDDIITGGAGVDQLAGHSGRDEIQGGDGNDAITGGYDRDRLEGGMGADLFIYGSVLDSRAAAASRDTITDFEQGFDQVDLSAFDGQSSQVGHQPVAFVGTMGFSGSLGMAELRYRHADGRTFIELDTNGDGSADLSIRFNQVIDFTSGDFIL